MAEEEEDLLVQLYNEANGLKEIATQLSGVKME